MNRWLLALILSAFAIASCDCTPAHKYYPAGNTQPAASEEFRDGPHHGVRSANQRLMSHIKERTVLISVDCTPKEGVVILGTSNPKRYGDGWGTGIIVRSTKDRSYLFTAAHVIEFDDTKNAKHFDCVINIQRAEDAGTDDNKMVATLVAKSTGRDVAVLRVPVDMGINTALEVAPFTGENVWAAGFPVQKMSRRTKVLSITKGTLATLNVPARKKKFGHYHRVTSQIYFGNSGGGIWNKQGKLLAVVSSMFANSDKVPYEGYYYTKPVSEVLHVLTKSLKYEEVFGDLN
jgi:S1-C subfamily serine protease